MTPPTTRQQVRRVLLITLVLNLLVAVGKIVLGLASGALAITADGLHSVTDAAGNVAGLVANHYAARPPDDDHPYGHRRFETMAALLIGGLLLLTAWEMLRGIRERLHSPADPDITPMTFAVLLATLLVNVFVSRYQVHQGRRLNSEILLADAQNTRADVFVTLSVMASMALVALGLGWMDTLAAVVVVGLIVRAAWGIVRQTGQVLVDTAPYTPEHLTTLLQGLPGVGQVIRARSRGPLDAVHIDLELRVPREMTAEHAQNIRGAVHERLHDELDGLAEISVNFTPEHEGPPDYALAVRAAGDRLGLATHEVAVSEGRSGRVLELHVEVPPGQTLAGAHELVSQLEDQLRRDLPELRRIITHIEPAHPEPAAAPPSPDPQALARLEQQVRALLAEHYPEIGWHELRLRPHEKGYVLTLHAALQADLAIEAAHDLAEAAETLLRAHLPDLQRVTIHTEPEGA